MQIVEQTAVMLNPTIDNGVSAMQAIEFAGRNCYQSQDKITDTSYEKFIRNLISRGHETPLEFAQASFEIVTSRDVMAELTRHRLASFCISSQRYVKADKTGDIAFVRPEFYYGEGVIDSLPDVTCHWLKSMRESEESYQRMIEAGASAQDARTVLPNSTATKIVCSMNLRELRHFFKLRTSSGAYPPMRRLASDMLELCKLVFPVVFEDIPSVEDIL